MQALLLLAPALVHCDRLDEARAIYDEIIDTCRRSGDGSNLAAAHISRRVLWLRCGATERMVADLRATRKLASRLGNVQLERTALISLAEILYWTGRNSEALPLAERARELYLEHLAEHPMVEDHLLLARLLCSWGDRRARAHLDWIDEHCRAEELAPSARAMLAVVRAVVAILEGGDLTGGDWRAAVRTLRKSGHREFCVESALLIAEVMRHCKHNVQAGIWRQRAEESADSAGLWSVRLAAL